MCSALHSSQLHSSGKGALWVGDGQGWGQVPAPGWIPGAASCLDRSQLRWRLFCGKVTPPGRCDGGAGTRQEKQRPFCCASPALPSFLNPCQRDSSSAVTRFGGGWLRGAPQPQKTALGRTDRASRMGTSRGASTGGPSGEGCVAVG